MHKAIGVRELRAETSRILRRVREKGEAIDITLHGETIARIVPVRPIGEADLALWSEVDVLAAEIGKAWKPKRKRAVDEVKAGRRS